MFRKHLKKQQGESEDTKKTEVWMPGPGAWQPGGAIPEGYRIERNRRSGFPRGERIETPFPPRRQGLEKQGEHRTSGFLPARE